MNELNIRRFKELAAAEEDLRGVGIKHLHQLASSDQEKLATALNYSPEEAQDLVQVSKQLLSELAEN